MRRASALPSNFDRAMREASSSRTVTDTDSYAFFIQQQTPKRGRPRQLIRLMPYKQQKEFLQEIVAEFGANEQTLRCYTLESNPQIKIILFGKQEWSSCYIGFLINKHFHVLGLGSFSCINEDARALYVAATCSLPRDDQKLKVCDYSLFDEEEQLEITNKLKQIFPKQ